MPADFWTMLLLTSYATFVASGARENVAVKSASKDRVVPFAVLGGEIETHVQATFFDAARAKDWQQKNKGYAARITDRRTFAEETRRRLAELKTSHTTYYTPDDFEYAKMLAVFQQVLAPKGVKHLSVGADIARLSDGWCVRRTFAGGAAAGAGIMRGDYIVAVNGKPMMGAISFQGLAQGADITLSVRQQKNGPIIDRKVKVSLVNPKQEWLADIEKGSRVFVVNGRRIGYIPVFCGAGEDVESAIRDVIVSKLGDADSLVLDIRDGYGGCGPNFVDLFHVQTPVLSQRSRDGKEMVFDPHWRKPLVLLINGGSRSGKEMVAFTLKKYKRATLIGAPTAGAVVAGKAILLSDRSFLYLAATDVRIDGTRLEGVGVAPDIPVSDSLPFAHGEDPQLDAAVNFAAGAAVSKLP